MQACPKAPTTFDLPSCSRRQSESSVGSIQEAGHVDLDVGRQYVDDFLEFAWTELEEDFLVLSFLPLSPNLLARMPAHALAPAPEGDGLLNFTELEARAPVHRVVLGVCTFGDEEEKQATRRILAKLRTVQDTKIFVVLLMPGGQEPVVEQFEAILDHHSQLIEMGVEDVFMPAQRSPGSLRQAVRLSYASHVYNASRMRAMIQNHLRSPWVLQSDLKLLAEQEQQLLWHDIPAHLMPSFKLPDRTLRESDLGVGQYLFQERYTEHGRVFAATTRDQVKVAVKVIEKSKVHSPVIIECIWRELEIPRAIGGHPNIVRCAETLSATINYYMVFEECGSRNLEQYCAQQQQQRLDEDVALKCFKQVASALALIHSKGFAHRLVSLHHVVVKEEDPLHFTLIDFNRAVRAPLDDGEIDSHCGALPCIAPEVAFRHAYSPCLADSWSLGVLLLEMAGGLTSLTTSAKAHMEEQQQAAAQTCDERQPAAAAPDPDKEDLMLMRAIEEFFSTTRCHEKALGMISGVNSSRILFYIEQLVLLTPQCRMRIQDVSRTLE